MTNKSLASDYVQRASNRIAAVSALFEKKSWADVVRQSQEIVELALKGLLRHAKIEVPRIHDVSEILLEEKMRIPKEITESEIKKLASISKRLRRDRELSFYGAEDLTPLEFYKREDAEQAKEDAEWVVKTIRKVVRG